MAMNGKEIEISVPWGTIAAKTWGFPTNPIILMLHGLEDNANTFEYLACKLSLEYYYVSIDFPGHGKSDNLPSLGLPLQGMDYVYVIKILVDHFDRDKYTIIGHSFGGILGMQFGLVYPERIDKLFVLDTLWFELVKPANFGSWVRNKFEEFNKISHQIRRNVNTEFTYEQCFDLMGSWRQVGCELTPKSVETLLQRSIKPSGKNMYRFTRDPKVKNYLCYPQDERYACEVLKSHNISFKLVTIVTDFYEKAYSEYYPSLVEVYKKIGDWISVEGSHHVLLNDATVVARVINGYIDECVI